VTVLESRVSGPSLKLGGNLPAPDRIYMDVTVHTGSGGPIAGSAAVTDALQARILTPWAPARKSNSCGRVGCRLMVGVGGSLVLSVPVPSEEPEPVRMPIKVHHQIPRRIADLCAGGVDGQTGRMHPAALQLDHKVDVQPGQADRLHPQKVTAKATAAWKRRRSIQLGPPHRGSGPRWCRRKWCESTSRTPSPRA
jgi:hypothetical protein